MGGKERLRCAYCPYTTLHHDYIVQHSLEQHVCQVMCYGCLSKSFYSLRDLKDHIQRRHPQDPRAWGTYQFYSDKQRRTFLYFGRDVVTGKSRQYSFVSQDAVNECHGWLICAYVTHSYFNCDFYTHWTTILAYIFCFLLLDEVLYYFALRWWIFLTLKTTAYYFCWPRI